MRDKIAQLLRVAREQLACCEFIAKYPRSVEKKGFDTISKIDNFYKRTLNVFFYDSLLITASLLDNKDNRIISFFKYYKEYNYDSEDRERLEKIYNLYKNSYLKVIRDQLIGHIDIRNYNNEMPNFRQRGTIDQSFIHKLKEIQDQLVDEFLITEKKYRYNPSYNTNFFNIESSILGVREVMNKAKPCLTDGALI